jgi:putative transcriptional regulator
VSAGPSGPLESGGRVGDAHGVSDLAPAFLVAVPQMGDPNFARTVVLMLEHNDDGALGLIVNRPSSLTLGEVAESQDLTIHPGSTAHPVFVGGPVQPERGFVLHRLDDVPQSVALVDGLYVSGSTEALTKLIGESVDGWRLCLGFAGWEAGQLERELREGAWLTAPATAARVLGTKPDDTWRSVLSDLGVDPAHLVQGGGVH